MAKNCQKKPQTLRLSDVALRGDRQVDDPEILPRVAHILGLNSNDIKSLKVLKRSLDRRFHTLRTCFTLAVILKNQRRESHCLKKLSSSRWKIRYMKPGEGDALQPQVPRGKSIVIGAGPAGLMAAWSLLLNHQEVIVLERGDDVDRRLASVGHFWARSRFDDESNVCFGEGGAGAFSDGKLITRNRSRWREFVLETLVKFGAHEDILYEAQAHIGSNQLRHIIKSWRQAMMSRGAQIRFRSKVVDLIVQDDKVLGVRLADGEEIFADRVIWAVGGHARDSFEILIRHGVKISPRSLAMGFRIEHPQSLINLALSGEEGGQACEYKLKTRIENKGVYSFCMCPGGVVVAAASQSGHQVVNGMSCRGKKSPYANSALVVEVNTSYFPSGPLGGIDYQNEIEKKAFNYSDQTKRYFAPAQRLTDFIQNTPSSNLPKTSYRPGAVPVNFRQLLPEHVTYYLLKALPHFSQKLKGYITDEALLLGVETRTSCPLTVKRDLGYNATIKNLYCVGEGAGYAGGILSAAYDALDVLQALALQEK